MAKYKFEVNRCIEDATKDKIHTFETLKTMRAFIDEGSGYPMEVTVYRDGEQLITLTHSGYWRNDKHPTLFQMIGEPR